MPFYEYYCANCGLDYEVMRQFSQLNEPANCGTCGKPGERQISSFAFKSNTFTAPKFKASLEKPMRARDNQPAKDSD